MKLLDLDDAEASRDLALILTEIRDAKDSIVLLVRGAIVVDNLLLQLLERYLHFSDSAEGFDGRYKLFFRGKCELAMSVGLFSRSERDILLDFNRFRNRAAHRIDVHVHENEVTALAKQLSRYGWSPMRSGGNENPLSFIDTLKDIIESLVGLIIERIARISSAGKIEILGYDLNQSHWRKLGAFGSTLSVVTIARQRVLDVRRDKFREHFEKTIETMMTDERLAMLSEGELKAELLRQLEESPLPVDEINEDLAKEIQPFADRFGYKMNVTYTPGPVTLQVSRQDDPQRK